jgi:hypothetical protein
MCPRLPQDILDMVLDVLCDDKLSLKACSRASSLLLHRSRKHLHRVFTLEHNNCSLLSDIQREKLAQLTQLPAIIDYADEFRLVTAESKQACESGKDLKDDFWSIIGRFKHASKLQLVGMDWTRGPPTALQDKVALSCAFPVVRDLGIVDSIFVDQDEVLTLVSHFPLLTQLRFTDVAPTTSFVSPVTTLPGLDGRTVLFEPLPSICSIVTRPSATVATPALRSIHFVACQSGHIGIAAARSLLQASSEPEQVHSMTATLVLNKEEPSGSLSLIPLISRSLLDLHIIAQQNDSLAAMYPKFDAIHRGTYRSSSCVKNSVTKLLSLSDTVCLNDCLDVQTIRLSYRRTIRCQMTELLYGKRSSIWDVYNPILNNIRSDKLRQITFDVELLDIESDGLDKLQDLLRNTPFLGLKDIHFNIICDKHHHGLMVPRLSLLWKTGFDRLRSRCAVEIKFGEKEDVEPLFIAPITF